MTRPITCPITAYFAPFILNARSHAITKITNAQLKQSRHQSRHTCPTNHVGGALYKSPPREGATAKNKINNLTRSRTAREWHASTPRLEKEPL